MYIILLGSNKWIISASIRESNCQSGTSKTIENTLYPCGIHIPMFEIQSMLGLIPLDDLAIHVSNMQSIKEIGVIQC